MGDDQSVQPRPMANMITAASEGQISVSMTPEDFVYLDRDCEYFKTAIRQIQGLADQVSEQSAWGLGEANDAMTSARTVVGRFKVKASGALDGNTVHEIMQQHYRIVEDIQEVHRIIRDRMIQADSEFAAEFTRLNTELPERPPVAPKTGPYLLPDGTTR
ncbi:hypothetical protein [Nocardia arizonensis]|uniref:hypothetical protein n=1 Tax=Nocardia arizonensis TaxID=1141647 RepID=UPI000ACABD88|nr:hypothetical protein [Nocardia arizonensis]